MNGTIIRRGLVMLATMLLAVLHPSWGQVIVAETAYIVAFNASVDDKQKDAIIESLGGIVTKRLDIINAKAVKIPDDKAKELAKIAGVTRVSIDGAIQLDSPMNQRIIDQPEQSIPWSVEKIGIESLGKLVIRRVDVAVIDTGVDLEHPDIKENIANGINVVDPNAPPMDINGHGTHVAGIIAGVDNDIGILGVAPKANIHPVSVFRENGNSLPIALYSDIISGLEWCLGNQIKIINISFGTYVDDPNLRKAFAVAISSGAIIVASAGNNNSSNPYYPASYPGVISVSAFDEHDNRAIWSNFGPEIDLSAPGIDIPSTYTNNSYALLSGTDMAAPHVTGTIAVSLAAKFDTNKAIEILFDKATDIGAKGRDDYYGYGLLNAKKTIYSSWWQEEFVIEASANPVVGKAPLNVMLSARVLSGPPTNPILYKWDFSNDKIFEYSNMNSADTQHVYAKAGSYIAKAQITDLLGRLASNFVTVTVEMPFSIDLAVDPPNGYSPLIANFHALITGEADIKSYDWDFDGDGIYEYSSGRSPDATHIYQTSGSYTAIVRATDTYDNSATDFAQVDVKPKPRILDPILKWSWTNTLVMPSWINVMMTPSVIDLDGNNIPDIIFASTPSTGKGPAEVGVLRALSGDGGAELFTVNDTSLRINRASSIATGDIDLDGKPEIIACDSSGAKLICFENDGTFKWRSQMLETAVWGAPVLADLEGDGIPEIIVGRQVLNNKGLLKWIGTGGCASHNGIGPLSLVADINMDGSPDIVAGNTAYKADGSIFWQKSLPDGFNAVANFDDDPFPEIVLVSSGSIWLLEHDGMIKWGPVSLPGGGFGGAPTISDYDNDGKPEIGVAGAARYTVFETNGTIMWSSVTQDRSSGVTSSSVFDFDDNGLVEIVYRDELNLRIYRGVDGQVLFEVPMSSGTLYEYPIVVDIDNNGSAEIVVVANNNSGFGSQQGIFVFGSQSNSWMPTRNIWNQHTYHITNINDDGTIPSSEKNSWEVYNDYRCNYQILSEVSMSRQTLLIGAAENRRRANSIGTLSKDVLGNWTYYESYGLDANPIKSKLANGKFQSSFVRPEHDALLQNYPNPFNPETWIPYQLKNDSQATIQIYSASGKLIRKLELGYKPAGIYRDQDRSAYWDGKNETGEKVPSGLYFYAIQAGDFTATRKMTLMK